MSSYIYGGFELAEALTDVSGRQLSIRMAEDVLARSWQAAGWEGIKQTAAEYGLNAVVDSMGNPVYYTNVALEGVTETAAESMYATATEAAIDSVSHEVVVSELKQVATQGATKTLTSGGLTLAAEALAVIGAAAVGAGLGWKSYKEHPDAWTDLSEAIFDYDADKETPLEVIARVHSGGYTTAVKEEHLAKVYKGLADAGCFDYKEYESMVDHTGVQTLTWTSVPALGKASQLAQEYAALHYPGYTCVQAAEDSIRGGYLIEGYTWFAANLPETGGISQDGAGYYTSINAIAIYTSYNLNTEEAIYAPGPQSSYSIYSGRVKPADVYIVGGLCANITYVVGDNDLFPNNHSEGILSIPPNASLSEVKTAIEDQFPDWYDDSWVQPEYDPETGTIQNNRYYPITVPWWDYENEDKDPNYDQDGAQEGNIDPDNEPQAKEITKTAPDTVNPVKPYVPIVPPVPTPPYTAMGDDTGVGLWAVYNPTLSELNDLGAYLWSSNIIDILQKFLQNPMDAIISLHKIFATPTTGEKAHIILGYLDSGVQANTVTKQFVNVDCGSVTVPEYFSDARDFDIPYTEIECYLPFIGIVRLKTADIIGGTVNIVYSIDTYSGACLAKIYVTKLGAKQLLYNFSSNCSMQIPLTGSDRTRLLSGAVAGAVGGAAMGGPIGAVAGAVAGTWKGGTSIERTSGFSANAGCMGVKKPYLIITRKYSYDAGDYEKYYGFPCNNTVLLGSCIGFTRVKSMHIESIGRATDNEKKEIETLLKQGVIIK